jgi:phenylalanyl-tRNA synthetase beta chain
MKLSYSHLIDKIPCKPSIEDISQKLFQLGHENEIDNNILDIEITPNRGDCLSVNGILRELKSFYEIDIDDEYYEGNIKDFDIEFSNNSPIYCPRVSFLKIDIDNIDFDYKGCLKNYFDDLKIKKNNFFTDISNYISYEMGQPTHCFDAANISGQISLDFIETNTTFQTLLDQSVKLSKKNLVFTSNNEIISLAGIMGGKKTACNQKTKSVIVECATFNPEAIIGKSIEYNLQSDAAYKFERGVDPLSHETVLRRFAKIVEEHTDIKNIQIFSKTYQDFSRKEISFDFLKINKILGIDIDLRQSSEILKNLGFKIRNGSILPPSYRSDINTNNDIAEEVARVIGYDNISRGQGKFNISYNLENTEGIYAEREVKLSLLNDGFFEVINNHFSFKQEKNSLIIDNPLDTNKKFIRTNLKESLIENLAYNERRQKDSVKLFEISDVYLKPNVQIPKKIIGIIATGRIGKNYKDFSKKIDKQYLENILKNNFLSSKKGVIEIPRERVNSKKSTPIFYIELELNELLNNIVLDEKRVFEFPKTFTQYQEISDFPSSFRDLSFSVKDPGVSKQLQNLILDFQHPILKEGFIFDYFVNKSTNEIKIGFRLIFQSKIKTIEEEEVNNVLNAIIDDALSLKMVEIPGLAR